MKLDTTLTINENMAINKINFIKENNFQIKEKTQLNIRF